MNEEFILAVIDKFNSASIAELDFTDGTVHLTMRKDAAFNRTGGAAPGGGSPANESAEPANRVHLGLPVLSGEKSSGNETIISPIVATFFGAPGPDAPPFVKSGSRVKAGDSLCILEAMKMMNHLEAEFDCEIVSVLASNGDLVEYGQALFEVKRL
jgi:acetyl-CoA carboxylase biotin carboxyl carrier protein